VIERTDERRSVDMMIDTKTVQEVSVETMYASLGAGQVVFEKAKGFADWARSYSTPEGFRAFWTTRRERALRTYSDLARRGRKLARSIGGSAPVKRAEAQTRTARSQAMAAATSARKAVAANVEAAKAVAKKVG
jgi:hypothetical protein